MTGAVTFAAVAAIQSLHYGCLWIAALLTAAR